MKKKVVVCLFVLMSLFIFTGCEINFGKSKKSVVLYFSATGTTKVVAEKIAEESDSEIIEIVPKEKYENSDLNYGADSRVRIEQNDDTARPKIKNEIDISDYEVVYLGFPIWFGYNPRIIYTFLDKYDLRGKTIIPFCTSGNTDIKDSVTNLRNEYTDLEIKDGKRFAADASDKEIKEFVKSSNE